MSVCPTMCDPDCGAICHEVHQVPFKREHSPEDCRATQLAEAERRGAARALRNHAARLSWSEGDPESDRSREHLLIRADEIDGGGEL